MSLRLSYIEIDLPVCSLAYGSSPCTAAIGVTGEKKCFNTRKTCQDKLSYSETTQTIRFAVPTDYLPPTIDTIANITGISYTPSKLDLGASIGARSVLSVNFHDHPSPDTGAGGDPYLSSRNYDPYTNGTFWGKFKARHAYLRGRELRWYNGKVGDTLANMEVRTFVIDRIEGPDARGSFRVVAKDPLTIIDDKRAQAPLLSNGSLLLAITDTATTLTLEPSGVGAEYPVSGKVSIGGNEIVSYTRSGDVLTITRAQNNTEAKAHDEGDRVQLVLEYNAQDPADIIYDLMVNYGNVPASYINLANWQSETSTFLGRTYSAIIAEPVSVTQLVNEILEQSAISVWWSETAKTLRLQVLRAIGEASQIVCDDLMLSGSFSQKEQPAKRVSQVWTYYGQINPLEPLDDPKNYRTTLRTVNLESEINHGTPSVKQIYSRWITQFGRTATERLNNLLLSRYSEPPRMFKWAFLRDSGINLPMLGDGYNVCSLMNQDDEGNMLTSPCQAVSVKVNDSVFEVEAEEVIISAEVEPDDPTVKIVTIDSDTQNVNFRTVFLQVYTEAQTGDTVVCRVANDVVVGSDSTTLPAFDTGTGWPSGITLKLENNGIIAGKGGKGGDATATQSSCSTTAGANGGLALKAQDSLSIDNAGIIGGGGGGGGGSSTVFFIEPNIFETYPQASSGGGGGGFGLAGLATTSVFNLVYQGLDGEVVNGGDGGGNSGGNGGSLGNSGANGTPMSYDSQLCTSTSLGGQAGNAVEGDSLVTWVNLGDVRGNRVG